MMNFFDKHFDINTPAQFIKDDYNELIFGYQKPGIYGLDNLSNAVSTLFITKDKGWGSVPYLVETFSESERYIASCVKISYEKQGTFYCVGRSSFVTMSEEDGVLGPVRSFEGFAINDRNEVEQLDTDDAQIKFEWASNAIDMVYQDTQSFALVREQ